MNATGPGQRGAAIYEPGAYPTWQFDAAGRLPACLGADLAVFFPGKGGKATVARAICRRCPLRTECRDWAMSRPTEELHGIWGGMTRYEREQAKRKAGQPAGRWRGTKP